MTREELEEKYGQVWTTEEMKRDFTVKGFCMCLAVVVRKSDEVLGSLDFTHDGSVRHYFNFVKD